MALLNMHLWDFQRFYHQADEIVLNSSPRFPTFNSPNKQETSNSFITNAHCILHTYYCLINDETRSLIQTITACVLYMTFLQHTIHFV